MSNYTVLIRQRGTITLPAKIRSKYGLDEGTPLVVVDLGEGRILLSTSKNAARFYEAALEFERQLAEAGVTLEDLLEGLREERERYSQEKYGNLS